jgi:hypothetical protein
MLSRPFVGYKLTMPAEDRVGRKQGAELFKLPAAENLAFDGQATTLLIG